MFIIDFHTHAFNEQLAEKVMAQLTELGHVQPYYNGTILGLRASMAAANIGLSVIQPVATKPTQVAAINQWSYNVSKESLFMSFGAIHPDLSDSELDYTIQFLKEKGFKGVKMHPEYQLFCPDEDRMERIYTALQSAGLILLLHSGIDLCFDTEVKATPKRILQTVKSFPQLTVVAAHMGGFRMWEQVEKYLLGTTIWLDTAYSVDECPKQQFEEMVQAHGADHILFGSDGPWGDQKGHVNFIETAKLTENEKALIFSKNALQLLGIETKTEE